MRRDVLVFDKQHRTEIILKITKHQFLDLWNRTNRFFEPCLELISKAVSRTSYEVPTTGSMEQEAAPTFENSELHYHVKFIKKTKIFLNVIFQEINHIQFVFQLSFLF